MIYPPITNLIEKTNSRYSLVIATAKRAREISEDEYVRMLRDYSTTIGTGMPRNTNYNRHGIYEIYQSNEQEEKNLSKSLTKIYDISGKPCDIRELYKIQKNGI